jgi:hypothetical protein
MRNLLKLSLIILLSSIVILVYGQQDVKQLNVKWMDIGIKKPYALNCVYDEVNDAVPKIVEIIDLSDDFESISVELINMETSRSDNHFEMLDASSLKPFFEVNYETGYLNKKPVAVVKIALVSQRNGQVYFLNKADISISYNGLKKSTHHREFKSNSVLATGNWRKIKTTQSGVYKITYEELQGWGMSNPADVRIYGTGARMLSKRNDSDDPDDLYENPIYMETHGDGIFNAGDYILFYGQGNIKYMYDKPTNRYSHIKNLYSDDGAYFVTTDLGPGKRIVSENNNSQTEHFTTNSVDVNLVWDDDVQNPISSGRLKYGELFTPGDKRDIVFNIPSNIVSNENITIQTQSIGFQIIDEPLCSFEFKIGETPIHRSVFPGYYPNPYGEVWYTIYQTSRLNITQSPIKISTKFHATSIAARAAIDFVRVTARVDLSLFSANSLFFADSKNISDGTVKQFQIGGNVSFVWNVTDPLNPKNMVLEKSGAMSSWKHNNDNNQFYIAFNNAGVLSVADLGVQANQNIHGKPVPDMIIVTAPLFRQEAERLADYRRSESNLDILILEPEEIYNEFSSGIPDVSAIRNMACMFYQKSGGGSKTFKYLLLIGDGSYDNKWAAKTNNHILTYQNLESLNKKISSESDDFFGLLDTGEGGENLYGGDTLKGLLDIGVGRLPVETSFDAQTVVNKIINYSKNPTLDAWKNELTFLADDADNAGDAELQKQAYHLAAIIMSKYPWFHNNLIFMDAYNQISTPTGQRYPAVREAINSIIHKGTLIFNYTGHGSPNQFAHESAIDKSMVNSWKNINYLPFFMTASCEISPYDNHKLKSIGEMILLNPNGGAVSMFTTTRLVYGSSNHELSISFYNRVFERNEGGNYSTLGEIMKDAKNQQGVYAINSRKFTLFGDPSMKLIIPPYKVVTDSINGKSTQVATDTIGALQKVEICGSITDTLGNHIPNYNGVIHTAVYDKFKERQTLGNDGQDPFSFLTQDNILYKGKSKVVDGKFKFEFIVPLDIDYDFGKGKIEYYAQDGTIDAQGAFRSLIIGGSSNNIINDTKGPEIDVYMNDTNFVSGSSTNESPLLIAHFFDEHGINTTGNGIGHEITATLKHDMNNVIILNNHFESDIGSYQRGKLQYQLLNLPDGPNQVTVCAWDIVNNSTETKLDFVVANTEKAALSHVLNYPNPFTTHTKFLFEHNQPHVPLEITIQIFTVSGKLVKTLQTTMQGSLYQTNPLTWDGLDDFGDRIGRGVYVYKVKIKTPDGKTDTKFERLVILK